MKMYLKKLLPLLTLLPAVGCKRLYPATQKVNAVMEQQLYFKEGSYWIYLDSVANATDSFCVRRAYKDILPIPTYKDNQLERITIDIDVYRNGIKNDSLACKMNLEDTYYSFALTNSYTNSKFACQYLQYPWPVTYPQLQVRGNTYNNVYDNVFYLLNADVGFIRFQYQVDTTHATSYILLRSKVVR